MRNTYHYIIPFIILLLSACGGGNSNTPTETESATEQTTTNPGVGLKGITSLSISPTFSLIKAATTIQLTAIGTFADNTSRVVTNEVKWVSFGGGTVSDTGLVTSTTGSSVSIGASDWANRKVAASAIVTVSPYGPEGTLQQPINLTVDQPHHGEVNDGRNSYYRVELEQNENYYIHLSNARTNVDLYVYSDANYSEPLCASTDTYYSVNELCAITDATVNEVFIKVRGNDISPDNGTDYMLQVLHGHGDQGTRHNPVAIQVSNESISEVGLGESVYIVDVDYSAKYTITLSNLTDNVDLRVYNQNNLILCDALDSGDISDEICQVQANTNSLYVIARSKSTLKGASFTINVSQTRPAYINEGSATNPINITDSLPYSGQTGNDLLNSSYYAVNVTAGKSYAISLTNANSYIALQTYNNDSSFTTTSCLSQGSNPAPSCFIEPASGDTLYFKVSSGILGTDYTINITEIVYNSEGAQASPLLINSAPTNDTLSYIGQVDDIASYYKLSVDTDAIYYITATKLSGDIGLSVYDDANLSTLLCSSNNTNLDDEVCETTSPTSSTSLYIIITGSTYGSRFDLTINRKYNPEGSTTLPKDITGLLPYDGEVGANITTDASYYKIQLTQGKTYRFTITNTSTSYVYFNVYDEDPSNFSSAFCSFISYLDQSCIISPITSATGIINLKAYVTNSSFGAGFTINVEEIEYQSEGTISTPASIGSFPVPEISGDVITANKSLTYNGQAGLNGSYYLVDISGGYDYVEYKARLTNLTTDADLYVYDDEGFSNLLCVSKSSPSTEELCLFNTTRNQIYIRVDASTSGFGAIYTLEIDHDYHAEGMPVTGKGASQTGGAIQLSMNTLHHGETDNINNSYYQIPVVADSPYTLTLTNLFNRTCIRHYPDDDGTFTSSDSFTDTNYNLDKSPITVTSNSDTLYFSVNSCGFGSIDGTAYSIEVAPQ